MDSKQNDEEHGFILYNGNGEDIPVICKDRMKAYLTELSNSTSSVKILY